MKKTVKTTTVILLRSLEHLGKSGQQVQVRQGYATNYLIPQEFALPATPSNIQWMESRLDALHQQEAEELEQAQARIQAIPDQISIAIKAGEDGRLYGSVSSRDIVAALAELGHELNRSEVHLTHGAIRNIGEHEFQIRLAADIHKLVQLEVKPKDK